MTSVLKYLRELNNYSQEELAEKLGITRQSYIKYEKNIQINDLTLIKKLASFYDVDYSCFIENKLIIIPGFLVRVGATLSRLIPYKLLLRIMYFVQKQKGDKNKPSAQKGKSKGGKR